MHKTGLHWFRTDLRVNDNEALARLSHECEQVVAVFVLTPDLFAPSEFGLSRLGKKRQAFINEALNDLKKTLLPLNIELQLVYGSSVEIISSMIEENDIDAISYEHHCGVFEQNNISSLKAMFPNKTFYTGYSNYLYSIENLPFEVSNLPDTFSPFRKAVEKYTAINAPSTLTVTQCEAFVCKVKSEVKMSNYYQLEADIEPAKYSGGESEAHRRINDYFYKTNGIASYKETRNGLDGWSFSSRLSAYLSLGCISPRQVCQYLCSYEKNVVKNESTYWLFFELLWREFFQWQMIKHEALMFVKWGLRESKLNIPSDCHHNSALFDKWCKGETDFKIVNACMKQLNATGFMSNRGRQLVASCFINELGLDWRYGAAYFEHHLIDFDVASNYGNWQYLAGVGSDPRGLRQFNLAKQTQIYDPEESFINQWL